MPAMNIHRATVACVSAAGLGAVGGLRLAFGGTTRRVLADNAVAEIADQAPGAALLDARRRRLIGPRLLAIGLPRNDDERPDNEGDNDFGDRPIAEGVARGGGHEFTGRGDCGWDAEGTDGLRRGFGEEDKRRG